MKAGDRCWLLGTRGPIACTVDGPVGRDGWLEIRLPDGDVRDRPRKHVYATEHAAAVASAEEELADATQKADAQAEKVARSRRRLVQCNRRVAKATDRLKKLEASK